MVVYGNIIQEKGIWDMNKGDNTEQDNDTTGNHTQNSKKFVLIVFGKEIKLVAIITALITAIVVAIIADSVKEKYKSIKEEIKLFLELPGTVNDIQEELAKINDRLDKLDGGEDNAYYNNDNNEYLFASADVKTIKLKSKNDNETNNEENFYMVKFGQVSMEYAFEMYSPSFLSMSTIKYVENDEEVTMEQLIGETILIPYKSGNQEVYFLGRFNEENQWIGKCIINVYENGNLVSIMEAEYNNGNLSSYKQVMRSSDFDTWRISDRVKEEDYNSGKTWEYDYIGYPQDFEFDSVTVENILYIDEFENYIMDNPDSWLEEFYCGNTSNGLYNDGTGNAYLAKYSEDGKVKLLYVGNFENGYPNDENAWNIAYSEEGGYYVQNTGKFKDGRAVVKSNEPLSIDDINEIISEYDFDDKLILNWK